MRALVWNAINYLHYKTASSLSLLMRDVRLISSFCEKLFKIK